MSTSTVPIRLPVVLLTAVDEVAVAACTLDPSGLIEPVEVTQRLWNDARYALFGRYGRLPAANEVVRQISNWIGRRLGWREVLELAHATGGTR